MGPAQKPSLGHKTSLKDSASSLVTVLGFVYSCIIILRQVLYEALRRLIHEKYVVITMLALGLYYPPRPLQWTITPKYREFAAQEACTPVNTNPNGLRPPGALYQLAHYDLMVTDWRRPKGYGINGKDFRTGNILCPPLVTMTLPMPISEMPFCPILNSPGPTVWKLIYRRFSHRLSISQEPSWRAPTLAMPIDHHQLQRR